MHFLLVFIFLVTLSPVAPTPVPAPSPATPILDPTPSYGPTPAPPDPAPGPVPSPGPEDPAQSCHYAIADLDADNTFDAAHSSFQADNLDCTQAALIAVLAAGFGNSAGGAEYHCDAELDAFEDACVASITGIGGAIVCQSVTEIAGCQYFPGTFIHEGYQCIPNDCLGLSASDLGEDDDDGDVEWNCGTKTETFVCDYAVIDIETEGDESSGSGEMVKGTCENLVTEVETFGAPSKGFNLTEYPSDLLYIGCPSSGCTRDAFFCDYNEDDEWMMFGTYDGYLRASISNGTDGIWPTAPETRNYCCNATFGMCDAPNLDTDIDALCQELGWNFGDIRETQDGGATCPTINFDTETEMWGSDFMKSDGAGKIYVCRDGDVEPPAPSPEVAGIGIQEQSYAVRKKVQFLTLVLILSLCGM